MQQFYFLSIMSNIIGGLVLSSGSLSERFPFLTSWNELFKKNSNRLLFGIAAVVFGLFKILSVTKGDVVVVGDIIPAFTGIGLGVTFIIESYQQRSTVSSPAVERLDNFLVKNKTIVGVLGIVAGILHFLFPSVLLL